MADALRQGFERARPEPAALSRLAVISLHASPTAPLGAGGNGGMSVYVSEVVRAFGERGIQADVFTAAEPGPEPLDGRARVITLPLAQPGADKYGLLESVPSFAEALVENARQGRGYDLVFSHYWLSGAAAALARRRLDVPWVHVAHTLALVKNRSLPPGARPEPQPRIVVEREIAATADLLVASTQAEREDLVHEYGAARARVAVIAPGVDLATFRPQPAGEARIRLGWKGRTVLFVGRLERLKGGDVAIRALAELAPALPDLRLLVVGEDSRDSPPSEEGRLHGLARELGLGDRVAFAGSVAHDELPLYYSAAVACLVPSHSESFGLVALEAQACGCPVIAADLPGLATIVRDGVTGYLVDGHDPRAYAERLRALLADPQARAEMGNRATLLAQRFTWGRTAARLLEEMGRLLPAAAQAGVQAGAEQEYGKSVGS